MTKADITVHKQLHSKFNELHSRGSFCAYPKTGSVGTFVAPLVNIPSATRDKDRGIFAKFAENRNFTPAPSHDSFENVDFFSKP